MTPPPDDYSASDFTVASALHPKVVTLELGQRRRLGRKLPVQEHSFSRIATGSICPKSSPARRA